MTTGELGNGEERMLRVKMEYEQKLLDKAILDKDEVKITRHKKNVDYYDKKIKKLTKKKTENGA